MSESPCPLLSNVTGALFALEEGQGGRADWKEDVAFSSQPLKRHLPRADRHRLVPNFPVGSQCLSDHCTPALCSAGL